MLLSVQLLGVNTWELQVGFVHPKTLSSYPGLTENCTCLPMGTPTLGDIKPNCFLKAGQEQLPPYRGRSESLEKDLQSKELVSLSCQLASLV